MLSNLAEQKLKARMPVEVSSGNPGKRRNYAPLEAFGRTMSGIAPWLALSIDAGTEADLRQRYADLGSPMPRSRHESCI